MTTDTVTLGPYTLSLYTLHTAVVGTGAAGFNAADRLYGYGQTDIAMVTENIMGGASRNTGSDKQTYYKLTLSGGEADSVRDMAGALFAGQCVDGDIALCEAALSAQCFLRLVELGVPFPRNPYGEYVGYKTDHDPRRRATSVGPYTSKKMTECLQASVQAKGIPIFDQMQVIRALSDGKRVHGLLCLDLAKAQDPQHAFVLFCCQNIVYATGGPAGMYANSAYPPSQYGATGLAFEAGVVGKNLTEWQYGLASLRPRWNVSGTYMQALPRFISTDAKGGGEREFLFDHFQDEGNLLTNVFLKGYQWPFDVRKVDKGSSAIDLLVHKESGKGRKVFLDFRQNPGGGDIDFDSLSPEARAYLQSAGACLGTPYQRLAHMNQPAVDFYREKGVDLHKEPLEIALCAQHNNGGLGIDCWWQTNIEGFFAVGEAAASHGVYRPGGSALNAGQVGSTRAAQYIVSNHKENISCENVMFSQAEELLLQASKLLGDHDTVQAQWEKAATRMSRIAGPIRDIQGIQDALADVKEELRTFYDTVRVGSPDQLHRAFRLRDMLLCQQTYLAAMADYIAQGGKSRGSALYAGRDLDDGCLGDLVQEVLHTVCTWRKVRPMPQDDDFFENVWREFRRHLDAPK